MSIRLNSKDGGLIKRKIAVIATALAVSGIVGVIPAGSLYAQTSSGKCTFTRDLTLGRRGSDVTCLQEYLMQGGYFTYSGGATGYFGTITRKAVSDWQKANSVFPTAGYFGMKSRAKYNVLVASTPAPAPTPTPTPGTPAPVPAGSGLTVAATADQPGGPSEVAPLGATRVPFTKFTLTASADGDVTVKTITVERKSFADDDAFTNVMLLDKDGLQVGTTKTLNSVHQAILNDPIVIKAGTTQTFSIGATMLASAPSSSNANQIASFAVVGVDAGTSQVNGALPILGGVRTVNETLTIGSVTMSRGSIDPGSSQTKEVGTTGYTFASVRVTAGSAEKVYLRGIRWNQTGSVGTADLANVKTYVDSTAYDTVVSSDGKYYIATFNDNNGKGLLIDKGFSKDISIKGDVAGGSNRTIDFDIAKRSDVVLIGENYGFGLLAPQTGSSVPTADTAAFSSSEDPWYDAAQVTVSSGTMTVSTSSAIPSQNVAINVPNQPIGGFTVDVKGEQISVGKLAFNVTLGSEGANDDVDDITNATIVDENGNVIAGPVDGNASDTTDTASSGDGVLVFSSTITFPTGLHSYKLLGKYGTDLSAPSNVTVAASTTPSSDFATVKGVTTGNTITPAPTSAITFNTMTIKSGALTMSVSSVPIAQNVIANSKAFIFANYILDATASGEDVRLTTIPLEYNVSSAGSATSLTNCQLYDGTTSITTGGNVVNPSAVASSTSFTFDGGGLVVSKGSSKTIALHCDVAGGAAGFYEWGLDSGQATNYTGASGVTSGQTVTETINDSEGQRMTASTGGSLVASLDSGSPGYKIANAGSTNVELARIRFSAANEDIDLKQVALQLTGTASNTPIDLVGRKVTLWNGTTGESLGEAVFATEDYATSSLIAAGKFRVPRDQSMVVIVKGDIAAITASGPLTASGDFLKVDWDGNNTGLNGTYGTGFASGNTITPTGSDTSSSGIRVMKAYPQFSYIALSSSDRALTPGTTANKLLYKFSVKAVGGDVALYKLSFAVSSSTAPANAAGATTSLFALTSYGEDSTFSTGDTAFSTSPAGLLNAGNCISALSKTTAGVANGAGNPVEVYMDKTGCNSGTTTYVIPSGKTYYFDLKATVASVESVTGTESFTVQLEGDAAYAVPGGNSAAGGSQLSGNMFTPAVTDTDTNDDFIWLPVSTTSAVTITDYDATNGFLVPGLPTTNMTAETFTSPN